MDKPIYVFTAPGEIREDAAKKFRDAAKAALGDDAIVFVLSNGMTLQIHQPKAKD